MSSKGFTLLEILVSISIFLLIVSLILGFFASILLHQRKALLKQELLNQTSYVIEYMSRALRFAVKDTNGVCLSRAGLNYENPNGDISRIKFINHLENDICQEFFLNKDLGILNEIKDQDVVFSLVSNKIRINSLKFKIFGDTEGDFSQPRVTIFLEAEAGEGIDKPKINMQTTISQRNLDE